MKCSALDTSGPNEYANNGGQVMRSPRRQVSGGLIELVDKADGSFDFSPRLLDDSRHGECGNEHLQLLDTAGEAKETTLERTDVLASPSLQQHLCLCAEGSCLYLTVVVSLAPAQQFPGLSDDLVPLAEVELHPQELCFVTHDPRSEAPPGREFDGFLIGPLSLGGAFDQPRHLGQPVVGHIGYLSDAELSALPDGRRSSIPPRSPRSQRAPPRALKAPTTAV